MVAIYVKRIRKLMDRIEISKIEAMESIPVPRKWWDEVLKALEG